MSDMPERIWAYETSCIPKWCQCDHGMGDTEYIRADVANAEIERLNAELAAKDKALGQAIPRMMDIFGWPVTENDAINAGEPELAAELRKRRQTDSEAE